MCRVMVKSVKSGPMPKKERKIQGRLEKKREVSAVFVFLRECQLLCVYQQISCGAKHSVYNFTVASIIFLAWHFFFLGGEGLLLACTMWQAVGNSASNKKAGVEVVSDRLAPRLFLEMR